MRPILISGHERALTQVRYNPDGDLIFSTSKDHVICAWYSNNGERLGTYKGHQGALWTTSINPDTTLLASGSADNTIKLWEIETGKCVHTWEFPTAIKRVEFSPEGEYLLGVTEKRMGHLGSIVVYKVNSLASGLDQPTEREFTITLSDAKATVAAFGPYRHTIIAGHEDGSISQWDGSTGEPLYSVPGVHSESITDLQFSADRTYFITSSKDKTAKLHRTSTLETMKTYVTDTPLNSGAIHPTRPFVVLGGGQAAMDVTTTAARQGRFEARIYHKILEDEVGRVRGHFGPLNTVAIHPKGEGYCSGGEDGYVRAHHFDRGFFEFKYNEEREFEREVRENGGELPQPVEPAAA
ncbi:MAG: hypothetical protein Q9162_004900 [Coniocarpon cinnabarinum]